MKILSTYSTRAILASTAIAALVTFGTPQMSFADTPEWNPKTSERMIKLPSSYLKKVIDRDYAGSELAGAMSDTKGNIASKKQTLIDLQDASELAEGEVRTELRHQFLAEKQGFIQLMGEEQELERQRAKTKIKIYNRLLKKLERQGKGTTPMTAEIEANQDRALQRLETASMQVDMEMFGDPSVQQSKYSVDYTKNIAAIQSLQQAINAHPMNQQPELDGEPISKQDYLRRLIQESETDLAILDQEENILGFMAKLVALDAMALADEVAEQNLGFDPDLDEEDPTEITESVALFIN